MTANQIAFAKAQEDARHNKMQEMYEATKTASQAAQARASVTQANAAWKNAITNELEHYRQSEESTSKRAANWGSAIGNFMKGAGGVLGAIASLM